MNLDVRLDHKSFCVIGGIFLGYTVIRKLSPEGIENVLIHAIKSFSNPGEIE